MALCGLDPAQAAPNSTHGISGSPYRAGTSDETSVTAASPGTFFGLLGPADGRAALLESTFPLELPTSKLGFVQQSSKSPHHDLGDVVSSLRGDLLDSRLAGVCPIINHL